MVDHFGEYNPWDMDDATRKLAEEAIASGGFVFRTGTVNARTGEVTGDGLQIMRVSPPIIEGTALVIEGTARRIE